MPETSEQPIPKPRDFRQEVTDNIVALLEKGVAPWQKPWDAQAHLAMPVNPTTDRAYRGGNAIHLLAVGLQRNYEDPRWMTYKQASEQGWQVKRGEKGTQIEFWDIKPLQDGSKQGSSKDSDQSKADDPGSRLVHRVYTVFNARQIDGISALAPKERQPFEVAAAGERILKNSGASIAHDQADRAYYDRRKDEIHLPPQQAFKDAAGYYGTALHELGHWTGHPSRLDRWTLTDNYKFGDTRYAKEELRAELASVFIAAEKGIPHDPQNHAAYVGSWIQALKQDKNEIFRAAHDGSKAADLLLSLERDVSIADQDLEIRAPENAATVSDSPPIARLRSRRCSSTWVCRMSSMRSRACMTGSNRNPLRISSSYACSGQELQLSRRCTLAIVKPTGLLPNRQASTSSAWAAESIIGIRSRRWPSCR